MPSVHPVLKFDIQAADFRAGLGALLRGEAAPSAHDRLLARWGNPGHALATTTLRAGFDLYLQALALPEGSEVLMSAITHPDMVEMVRHLGLVPVPVDIDLATMAPSRAALARAVSGRSRVLVVAQLFGGRFDLAPLAAFCRAHGLLLVEDCAQAFGGGYAGHPEADAAFFSFGPLKTRTALAGALVTVRDPALRDRMAALQAAYPSMTGKDFASRLAKYAVLSTLCSRAERWGLLCRAIERRGLDPNTVIRSWTRSLSGAFRVERFRVKPSAALLTLLDRRLADGDARRWVERRQIVGARLASRLAGLELPGVKGLDHLHWIFPVLVSEPVAALRALYEAGFQAGPGLSNLDTFAPPGDRPDLEATEARRILRHSLLLPMHPDLTDAELDRMADVVRAYATARAEAVLA